MPRKHATQEQRSEIRRRIRSAAAAVYREKGLKGVSVRAISTRARVSAGTLYRYYESLPDLMRSLWAEPVAEANKDLEQIAKANPDPVVRARALLEGYTQFALEHRDVFRGAMLFVRADSAPTPDKRPLESFVFYDLLRSALIEAQTQRTVIQGDVDEIAQVLWAGAHGALALPVNVDIGEFVPVETLTRATIDALLRAIQH